MVTRMRCVIALLLLSGRCATVDAFQADLTFDHSEKVGLHLASGEFDEAEEALRKEGKLSLAVLAFLRFHQGREEEGLAALDDRLTKQSEVTSTMLLENLTIVSGTSPQTAETLYETYEERYPTQSAGPTVILFTVRIKTRLQKLTEAIQILAPLIEDRYSGEKLKEAILDVALALETAGRPLEGRNYMDTLFDLIPETSLDPGYKLQWAHLSNAAKKPADALMMIDKIETNYPEYARRQSDYISIGKGTAHELLGQREEAQSHFEKLNTSSTGVLAALGKRKVEQYEAEAGFEKRMKDEAEEVNRSQEHPPLTNQPSRFWAKVVLICGAATVLAVLLLMLSIRKRQADQHLE